MVDKTINRMKRRRRVLSKAVLDALTITLTREESGPSIPAYRCDTLRYPILESDLCIPRSKEIK
jgi:hypothetical protein